MTDQLVLKSYVDDEALDRLRGHRTKYPFVPMVRSVSEMRTVLDDPDLNLVGVELLAPSAGHVFTRPETLSTLRDRGVLCLLNAINLSNRVPLFAGFDDEVSVLEDPDRGWGELVRLGADIIQTDWPALLSSYLGARDRRTAPGTSPDWG